MSKDILDSIFDLEETWFIVGCGNALLVNDCQLLDC